MPNTCVNYEKKCGGCPLLALPYREQLAKKQARLQELLGGFAPVKAVQGMAEPLHYRNKLVLHAAMRHGALRLGYRQEPVNIDEDTLQKIAGMTGGKYYRADNSQRFQAIYAEIDKLEKTEAEVKKYSHYDELLAWFILPGLGLLLLEVLLRHTVWRRLP